MNEREALKLALDYIVESNKSSQFWLVPASNLNKTVNAIKEALAQPEQEPVAVVTGTYGGRFTVKPVNPAMVLPLNMALYTTPPHCKPLTDVEIWNTYKNLWMFHPAEEPRLAGDILKFARAIEAIHGIKE